ncbi:MAG: hypothetical protein HQK75_19400, partial [Candidatus Magnetomorum sp.]|nr:hypothetical protein [Candidatus Magnetomorum sp.]
ISTITVDAGQTKTFGIKVTAPQSHLLANGEADALTLQVTSLSRAEVIESIQVASRTRNYSLTIESLASKSTLKAGQFYNYTLLFTNTGTADDTYNISTKDGNWIYALRNITDDANLSMISIPAGFIQTCLLKTTMPLNGVANGGSDTVTIHAISQGRSTISFDYPVTTDSHLFLFNFSQSTPVSLAWPDQTKTYRFDIENTGLTNDTYNITTNGNWSYKIKNVFDTSDINAISVASGMTDAFLVKVLVPSSTAFANGASETVTIHLISQGNPSASTQIQLAQTTHLFSFTLQDTTTPVLVYPGQTFNYQVQIDNTGLSLDAYDLTLTGGNWDYQIRNIADTAQINAISVHSSLSDTFIVQVTVPVSNIANGQSDTVTVQVVSQARHDVIQTLPIKTTTPTFDYSIQSLTQDMAVDLGATYNFRIEIQNNGLDNDTYQLSLNGGKWNYVVRNDMDNANINQISVDSQNTGAFIVKVSVPLTGVSRGESETITVISVSQGNANVSKNVQITTSTPTYSFDFQQVTPNAVVYPGQIFFYEMKVGNAGSYTDTYNLSLTPGSWAYAIRDNQDIGDITEISVGGGLTDTFFVKVGVPDTLGESDGFTITGASQGNTAFSESIYITSAIPTFSFNMNATAPQAMVLPDEPYLYSIQINNLSTESDTFDLSLTQGQYQYSIRNAQNTASISSLFVDGGATGTFLIKVRALDANALSNGESESITVNARSQGNPTISDALQITSTTPTYAFTLQNKSGDITGFAQQIIDYQLEIQNTGSYTDTFQISVSGN